MKTSGAPSFLGTPATVVGGLLDLTNCVSMLALSITENSTGKNLLTIHFTAEFLG